MVFGSDPTRKTTTEASARGENNIGRAAKNNMKKVIEIDTEDEALDTTTSLLQKEWLTASELYLIRLILEAKAGNYEPLRGYLSIPKEHRDDLHGLFVSLQRKAVLLQHVKLPAKGKPLNIDDIHFNKAFVKRLHRDSFDLGKELFEAYPVFGTVGGVTTQLNTVSKKFNSLEEAFAEYGRVIGNSPEKHAEVLEVTNWGKENDLIHCSLASYIVDRRWEALEALRNGTAEANVNFQAVKLL